MYFLTILFYNRYWHYITAIDEVTATLWKTNYHQQQSTHKGWCRDEKKINVDGCLHPSSAVASLSFTSSIEAQASEKVPALSSLPTLFSSTSSSASNPEFSFSVSFWWGDRIVKT